MTDRRERWDTPSGFDADWWAHVAELGWTSLLAAESLGGGCLSGCAATDAAIVAEEIGREAAPGPFLPVSLVTYALSQAGAPGSQRDVLAGLLTGRSVAGWALAESGDAWSPAMFETTIEAEGDELIVQGRKTYVEAVAAAQQVLVTGRTGQGLSQVLVRVDAPGVTVTPGRSIDLARRFGSISFDRVRLTAAGLVGTLGGAAHAVERQLQLALILQCAEINGATARVFEQTVEYAQARYAFGRPIGAYQALKHRLADMLQRLEFARAISDAAASAFDTPEGGDDAGELARVAKAYVADAGLDVIDDCVQINGGIGVTWEHDIHIYSRRVALDRALYGTPELHKETLVEALGLVATP